MWLILDVGNSAAKGAFFEEGALHAPFRLDLEAGPAAWQAVLAEALRERPVARIGIASVVPAATERLVPWLRHLSGVEAEVVRSTMRLPFRLAYMTPHTLGTDRLAAAAGAWVRHGVGPAGTLRPVVALDAGTAVTYEVIRQDGVFLGGTIGPGPGLLRDALKQGTAQLPAVPLVIPPTPIGRSTQEAIQAGVLFGFLDGVHGMLGRIHEALGQPPFVVVTGGWGPFLKTHLSTIDAEEPHLVLHGIGVLMVLNPP